MNKPLRYWVRRAIVSLPLWVFLVHEADTRYFDNGDRVFGDHHGMVLWTVIFILGWTLADHHYLSQRETAKKGNHR